MEDTQKEIIRKQARGILDNFAKTLTGVPSAKINESFKGESVREEVEGNRIDEGFKSRMLANAPNKDGDCIIAEKAGWV